MSIFTKIGEWFKKVFDSIRKDWAPVAVSITEGLKTALDSGVVGFVASLIDGVIKAGVAEEVVVLLKKLIPEILTVELAIEGLPDNPTEQDILAFEQRVISAFGTVDDKSKMYTTLAASLYGKLKDALGDGKLTFAEAVAIVEASYKEYKQYLIDNPQDAPSINQ